VSQKFIPGLLLAETYYPVKDKKGFTADIIEKSIAEGFYKSFEIGDIQDKEERKRILTAKEQNNIILTEWFTFLIDREHLDVSSLDKDLRLKTVQRLKEETYFAAECGVSNIAFVTGPDPGDEKRKDAMDALFESICSICEEAKKYSMTVLVEHLDRFAHKKRVLGPIDETVQLFTRVKENYSNIGIAFDTAHSALNGENVVDAIKLGKDFIHQIHFSNAVLDPSSELYGDHHMAIGETGFLTEEKISEILVEVKQLKIGPEEGLRVAVEARTPNEGVLEESAKTQKNILENALKSVVTN